MDPTQTIPFPIPVPRVNLETNPDAGERPQSPTVVLSNDFTSSIGSTALAQLEALSSLVKHEADLYSRSPSKEPDGVPVEAPPGALSADAAEGPEETLDDYMQQFMARVTGRKPEVVAYPQPVQPAATYVPPAEARQPARAPENQVNLDRMRDLAIACSRSALQLHEYNQYFNCTIATFLPAVVASLLSSGLAVIGLATGSGWWQLGSGGMLAVALVFGWQFWTASRKRYHSAA